MDRESLVKLVAGGFGAVSSYLLGGWTHLIQALLFFMFVDYVTGVAAAAYEAKKGKGPGLSSEVGFWGIVRKFFMVALVIGGYMLDKALGSGNTMIRDTFAWGLLANEFISFLENTGRMNIKTFPFVNDVVAILKSKGGGKPDVPGSGTTPQG